MALASGNRVLDSAKKVLFPVAAIVLGTALPYLLVEGIFAVAHGGRAETSLSYRLYARWLAPLPVDEYDPRDPNTTMITDARQIEPLLAAMRANAVGLGNSPYRELKTYGASINGSDDGGCTIQRPNLRKVMAFLKSNQFNPFDQVTYFHDADQVLPPALEEFFRRYGFRRVHLTTNEFGERRTIPEVDTEAITLVAGDSVADGAMLDDAETIASRLQREDPAHRYVNLGISGVGSADIICALEKAGRRYRGRVDRLLYVFCENDFDPAAPYGTGADLIAWLRAFQKREEIPRVTLLYMPYIYNTVPEVTRIPGHSHYDFPTNRSEKENLLAAARAAGFAVVDFLDLANAERERYGSQFAPLALYLDHTHPSPLGVDRLLPPLSAALR